MTKRRNELWRAVIAAAVVGTGLAVVWGILCLWITSTAGMFVPAKANVMDSLEIAADGTPVICTRSNQFSDQMALRRRTVDGKEWPLDYDFWLEGAWLAPHSQAPGLVDLPLRWDYGRLGSASDGGRPPVAWYMVRDDRPAGHCYFAGYDATSKLLVGYIGRNGFQANRPELEEQFAFPATNEFLSSYVASTQGPSFWGQLMDYFSLPEGADPPAWQLFLTESDRLWEIDLRQRTARVVLEMPNLLSVSVLRALESTVGAKAAEGQAGDNTQHGRIRLVAAHLQDAALYSLTKAAAPDEKGKPKFAQAIALRTEDKIVLFRPSTGEKKEFKLPERVPNKPIGAFWVAPDQLLVQFGVGNWSGGSVNQLFWVNGSRTIEKEAEVKLAGYYLETPKNDAWGIAAVAPVPIAWLVGALLVSPLVLLQNNVAPNYTNGLSQTFDMAWPPMVLVLVIGVVLAWAALRLHRKYVRPAAGVWAAFVFLLGVPGLLAYLVEHRRAKLEACAECGEVVPRDRDECAGCATPFAAPGRVGTEIFA